MPPGSRDVPDWQLPAGVSRGLWEYLHSETVAGAYDAALAHSPLLAVDDAFVARHLTRPGRVLDLGCGTGRFLVPLAQRGFEVVGVDLSDAMLAVAAGNARSAGVSPLLLKANIVELDCLRPAMFDSCLCMFSTLGLVQGRENRERVIGHASRLLRPGGTFIVHVHSRWQALRHAAGRRWLLRDLVRSFTGSPEAGDHLQPFHQGAANLSMHVFTRGEVRRLLAQAGLRVVEVQPLGIGGTLPRPWLLPSLREIGFLTAARKPE